jgi:hypothetical protein
MKTTSGSDLTSQIPEDKATDKNFLITVHDDDTVIAQLNYEQYKKFRDSIVYNTKDTLFSLSDAMCLSVIMTITFTGYLLRTYLPIPMVMCRYR